MLDKEIISKVFGFESEAKLSEGFKEFEAGAGGGDGWGANCNVGLNEGQKYIVLLRSPQPLNIEGVSAKDLENMANNMVVVAMAVKVSDKGRITITGTPFTALVGGRALCQAGCTDANSKNKAVREAVPMLLSYIIEAIPEEKRTARQKAAGITTKKIYTSSRLTEAQEKDVRGSLPKPAPTAVAAE